MQTSYPLDLYAVQVAIPKIQPHMHEVDALQPQGFVLTVPADKLLEFTHFEEVGHGDGIAVNSQGIAHDHRACWGLPHDGLARQVAKKRKEQAEVREFLHFFVS
jgi:hypothetical protein